jgi:hypothetical protein
MFHLVHVLLRIEKIWFGSYKFDPNQPRDRKRISFLNGTFFGGTLFSPKEASFLKFFVRFSNCHITGQGTVWNTRKSNMKLDEKIVVPYHHTWTRRRGTSYFEAIWCRPKKGRHTFFYVLGYIPRFGYIVLRLGIKVSTQLRHSEAIWIFNF